MLISLITFQRQNELSQEEQKKNQEEAKKLRLQVKRVHKWSMIIYNAYSQNTIRDEILHQPYKTHLQVTQNILAARVKTQMGVFRTGTSCRRRRTGRANSYPARLGLAGFWWTWLWWWLALAVFNLFFSFLCWYGIILSLRLICLNCRQNSLTWAQIPGVLSFYSLHIFPRHLLHRRLEVNYKKSKKKYFWTNRDTNCFSRLSTWRFYLKVGPKKWYIAPLPHQINLKKERK